MRKILICLVIPSVGRKYEIYVPNFVKICELIPLLSEAAAELTGHLYSSSGAEILCSVEQKIVLDGNRTLNDYLIGDGDHLVMM